jgi:hypothetical protein
MSDADTSRSGAALVHADQPWKDPTLAELYDAFPFDEDLPLYRSLANEQGGRFWSWAAGAGACWYRSPGPAIE